MKNTVLIIGAIFAIVWLANRRRTPASLTIMSQPHYAGRPVSAAREHGTPIREALSAIVPGNIIGANRSVSRGYV
jgi:hypothetical protein